MWDLDVRPESVNLLEENIGSMPFDISLSNIFFDMSPQAVATKGKLSKRNYIKLKNFYFVMETINKIKGKFSY